MFPKAKVPYVRECLMINFWRILQQTFSRTKLVVYVLEGRCRDQKSERYIRDKHFYNNFEKLRNNRYLTIFLTITLSSR